MEQLLKYIYHRLTKEKWGILPLGLKNGKMGLSWSLSLLYQKSILEKDEIV